MHFYSNCALHNLSLNYLEMNEWIQYYFSKHLGGTVVCYTIYTDMIGFI